MKLSEITSIEAYVKAFSNDLADKVAQQSEPLHTPTPENRCPHLATMTTKLFDKQADLVTGCVRSLTVNKLGVLACAMGTGKSGMGIGAVHCHGNERKVDGYRALVICPPHLVKKWKAEVAKFLGPQVPATIITNWEEFIALRYRPPANGPEWYIMAMTTAKLGYDKRCASISKLITYENDLGKQQVMGYVCPRCNFPIFNAKKNFATLKDIENGWLTCTGKWCKGCGCAKRTGRTACPDCGCELRTCGEPQWQARSHKVAPVQYLKATGVRWFDYFIRDECFPGNTLVLMGNHEYKRIDSIMPSEVVMSWNGHEQSPQKVSRVLCRRRKQTLVKVSFGPGDELVCTEGHKIYVKGKGYVKAKDLLFGEIVLRPMQELWPSGLSIPRPSDPPILQQIMRSCPSVEIAELSQEGERKDGYQIAVATGGSVQKNDSSQQRSGDESKDSEDDHREAVAWSAWRQWEGFNAMRKNPNEFSQLGSSHSEDGNSCWRFGWHPDSLQNRPGQQPLEDSHRSGRALAQSQEGSGSRPAKGGMAIVERMDSSKGQERGSNGHYTECRVTGVSHLWESEPAYAEIVYDLEVENTHCYFAGGVLVSNCHESKGCDSMDGHTAAAFAAHSKHTILATGTLLAGKSEDLRPLLFRLKPRVFRDLGYGWKDEIPFAEQYGRIQTVIKRSDGGGGSKRRTGRGSSKSTTRDVKPGIMPQLFPDFVSNYTMFMSLPELAINLPQYHEETRPIKMDPQMAAEYATMQNKCLSKFRQLYVNNRKMAVRLLGPMMEAFMTWPDVPYGRKMIGYRDDNDGFHPVYQPPDLDQGQVFPKEQALLDYIKAEKALGRKCWVFTVRDDVRERLQTVMEAHGFKVAMMTSTVPPATRIDWIAKHAPKCDVGLSHPQLVETGLELFGPGFNFPTLLWYSTGFRLNTLRQASRRSWRIGQPLDCKTVYLYYDPSAQQAAIAVMAAKLVAAEALEGKFSDGGLADESVDEDIALTVARNLADNITVKVQERYRPIEASQTASDKRTIILQRFASLREKLRRHQQS